jgi:hypothetical protein
VARAFWAAAVAVAVGLSVFEGAQAQSSSTAHLSVLVVIGVVLVAAVAAGRGRQATSAARWVSGPTHLRRTLATEPGTVLGAAVWTLLAAAAIGWDLYSFARQRPDLPTFSRIAGEVTGHWDGKSVVFGLWLVLGVALATGWRRPR